jgi:non-heme chloroperoxidase
MSRSPIVMLHGAFCGPWAMAGLKQKFVEMGYGVTTPCLRFHDTASPPAALGITGVADYAADLEDEIAALDTPPILVGHSMGGLLAQILASRRPAAALVLLAPSPPWGVPPATLGEISAAQAMFLNPGFWTKVLEPNRDIAFSQSLNCLPRDQRGAVFDSFGKESGRAMHEIMHWALDMQRTTEVPADAVRCPILCITGSEDRVNSPGTVARIAALYSDRATNEVLPGIGHWLIGEPGWEKLAERTLAWLDEKL